MLPSFDNGGHHMGRDELYKAISVRKSVREYSPGPLEPDVLARISSFMTTLRPAFPGIRTELKFMNDADVQGIFKVEAPHVLTIFSDTEEGFLTNAGFLLQQMDLFFSANRIGSCWQGGPKLVGKARSASDLEYVISLSFGNPSGNPHRRDRSEFKRKEMVEITNITGHDDLLEPARLAPSAANGQPWYFTGGEDTIQIHKARSLVLDRMNSISVGIAMCHLWLAVDHSGIEPRIFAEESGGENSPKRHAYVASIATI